MNLTKILPGSLPAGGALALSRLAAAKVPTAKPASISPLYAGLVQRSLSSRGGSYDDRDDHH